MPLAMTHPEDRPGDAAGGRRGTFVRPLLLLLLAALALLASAMAAGAVIDEDTVIDSAVEWSDAEYTVSANVTVTDEGSLTVNGSSLVFDAPEGVLVGVVVAPGGQLTLDTVTATAPVVPFFISSGGTTVITDSTLSGLYSSEDDETLVGLVGGVVASSGSLTMVDVDITTTGVGVSAFDCDIFVDGLSVTGGQYGLLLDHADADLTRVSVTDSIMAYAFQGSTVSLVDSSAERVNWTLWAVASNVTITGMDSRPYGDHLAFENGTSSIADSYFYDGQEGAVALLGYMEVLGCHFEETRTAVELLYAEGRIVDTLVEDCADMSIVLSFVGFNSDVPDFEMRNVTVRDGAEAALDIDSVSGITVEDLTVEGCGDGVNVASSEVTFRNVLITGSTQCREYGCSYIATGTGMLAETSALELFDVTIEDSNGPGVSSYWSYVNATSSTFSDGNRSGFLLVYSAVNLDDCNVTGNAWWGIESLGFDIDPDALDASWGNGRADIRMNMTINAQVADQHGKYLSFANVTASSHDLSYGPYPTGVYGRTQTYELAIYEWTDGGPEVDFNPWTFTVEYGDFTNSTDVVMQLGNGEVTLIIQVMRGDLTVKDLRAPSETGRDERTTIRATVGNQGNYTVESAILTFYYKDSNGFQRVIGEVRVGPLPPGGEDVATMTWVPDTRDKYTMVAFVDVDDLVDEEDDDNNRAERPIRVGDASADAPGPGAVMAVAVLGLALLASSTEGRRAP
jgi:hypothetical protein